MLELARRERVLSLLAWFGLAGLAHARDVSCGCGYYDPVTNDLWTDSTILYFNETDAAGLAANKDFVNLDFENLYESGFSTVHRQGASGRNIGLNETGALELKVNPSTKEHLVVGGGIRTTRRDIQFGSFRAGLQPAQPGRQGGSALSMYYHYNVSQNIELDLVNGERPELSGVTFKADLPTGYVEPRNFTFANVSQSSAELNEWRFDWTSKTIQFSTEANSSVVYDIAGDKHELPTVPGAIYFKHWSNGGEVSQGPPRVDTRAWIGYIRIFFNSTITSTDDVFNSQCQILNDFLCSTEDYTLRGSSRFPEESSLKWKLVVPAYKPPAWAIYGVTVTGTLMGLLILHAIVRRLVRHYSVPKDQRPVHPKAYTYKLDRFALHGELTREMIKEKKKTEKEEKRAIARGETPVIRTKEIDPDAASIASYTTTNAADQSSVRGFRSLASNKNSKIIASALPTMYYARPGTSQNNQAPINQKRASRLQEVRNGDIAEDDDDEDDDDDILASQPGTPRARSNSDSSSDRDVDDLYSNLPDRPSDELNRDDASIVAFRASDSAPQQRKKSIFQSLEAPLASKKFWNRLFRRGKTPTNKAQKKELNSEAVLKTSTRIDYLDGLRGICCLLVSLVHFVLTFYIGFISPVSPDNDHYSFVKYIRLTISPFFFNANFGIGIFFILSSRLIGVRYLKAGHLQDLAGSTFRRIPRLAFPILCAVVLNYFLIGVGATKYLEYLASITWSTWPYAVEFKNPGWFINGFLTLLYVQPPQLPSLIYNYCTGVLWTIPVSIQGSWLIFLGVIVVREIKTPWKRFGYYFFCMLNSWYALNWGAYFWIGLAISDLDANYRYRLWGAKRWRSWLIVLFLWIVMMVFMASQWAQQVTSFSLPTFENAVHPDLRTGLPIGQTERYGYPEFNIPQIHSLFAATALMILCDFSNVMQIIFRNKFLRALGYYSYSIYALHGVIFWSWGSWLCVVLSTKGVPYWANVLVVFITSYIILGVTVCLWTPFADVFSGYAGTALWRRAQGRSLFATIG